MLIKKQKEWKGERNLYTHEKKNARLFLVTFINLIQKLYSPVHWIGETINKQTKILMRKPKKGTTMEGDNNRMNI